MEEEESGFTLLSPQHKVFFTIVGYTVWQKAGAKRILNQPFGPGKQTEGKENTMTSEYDYSHLYQSAPSDGSEPHGDPAPGGGQTGSQAPAQQAAPQPAQPADVQNSVPDAVQHAQPSDPAGSPAPGAASPGGDVTSSAQTEHAAPSQSEAQQNGYPNVGSSGMNTANTARTDYAEGHSDSYAAQQNAAGNNHAGNTVYGAQNGDTYRANAYTAQNGSNGYENTAAQGGQNGNSYNYRYTPPAQQTQSSDGYQNSFNGGGAYNGYSYSSAPQPSQPVRKKGGTAKKVLLRIGAVVLVLALGFAGGFGGAVLAGKLGLTGSSVVVQQVAPRDPDEAAQGSAVGASLPLEDVASIVSPSVVVITTEQMVSSPYVWFGGSYVQSGAGSGVVMSEDGYIMTCAHVVNGAQNIKVTLADDTEYTATVIGYDTTADIAVVKIEATGLTPAVMGNSDELAVGETVLAVGNPLGQLGGTVTDGIVSAINREVSVESNNMTLIQTNAAISPGNSGGGLFNANGELIGIVNAKSSAVDETGNLTEAEGLGFAIPINTALTIAQDLIDVGFVQRPTLGVTVITINDAQTAQQYGVSTYGVYVYQVTPGSGAEQAGVQMGDRIAAVADVPVSENADLTDYLSQCEVGDTVTLQIERDGHLITVDVTLGVNKP